MIRHLLAAIPAALESLIVFVVGLGPCAAVGALMWAIHDHFGPTWGAWWAAAVRFWLLGLGAPMAFPAQSIAVDDSNMHIAAYAITLMPLGLTAFIVWRAWAGGRRFCDDRLVWPAWVGFAAAGAALGAIVAATTAGADLQAPVRTAWPAAALLPTVAFIVGTLWAGGQEDSAERSLLLRGVHWTLLCLRDPAGTMARALGQGIGLTLLAWLGLAAVLVSTSVFGHWTRIAAQYEQLQPDVLGVLVVTAIQLAFLPVLIVWAALWSSGVGFALGSGSSTSPFGTELAPLPSWPVLAALPAGWHALALIVLIVPVSAFVLGAWRLRRSLTTAGAAPHWATWWGRLLLAVALAVAVGVIVAVAAEFSQGAIGPGRLRHVGQSGPLAGAVASCWGLAVSAVVLFWPGVPRTRRAVPKPLADAVPEPAADAASYPDPRPASDSGSTPAPASGPASGPGPDRLA